MSNNIRTVGEIDGFINMLLAACEDSNIYESLEILLTKPDQQRKDGISRILKYLQIRRAPDELIEAISCLENDEIAEKAYEFIYRCQR